MLPGSGRAAGLQAEDGQFQDIFGLSVAIYGNVGLVGAPWEDGASSSGSAERGAAYLFRNLNTATGTITQSVKLIAGDTANRDELGTSVALYGNTALVGAPYDNTPTSDQGSVYLYRDLHLASGTITQNAKLVASDPTASANFGMALGMDGPMALVGAWGANVGDNDNQGAVYLYRNLDSAMGNVTENAKLLSSDGEFYDWFGGSVSLSGNMGVVGAYNTSAGGSAYLYRNLDVANGIVYEDAKFQNSNNEGFSGPVSLHGTSAVLVGGPNAYLYRNLDTAGGPLQEAAILSFSDATDYGGTSVALFGSTALIGDAYQNRVYADMGAAYLYLGLDNATGAQIEDVKIIATIGRGNDRFGVSVSLNGDGFVIGADGGDGKVVYSGKAYYGTVSSLTTLDVGNASRDISEISFFSRQEWVIGKTTSRNAVTLGVGDRAEILNGEMVYVGQGAGSNLNLLSIKGELVADEVVIGSAAGNYGNTLRLEETASFTITTFRLAAGNTLSLQGDHSNIDALLLFLGESSLIVWNSEVWGTVDADNYGEFIRLNFSSGYTAIVAIPEPTTWLLLSLGAIGIWLRKASFSPRRFTGR